MRINARFLEEARQLEARWATLIQPNIRDRFQRATTAVLLESQRLINEQPNHVIAEDFRRISVPLVRRLYPGLNEDFVPPSPKVNWLKEGF